jgi:hypothetical protein
MLLKVKITNLATEPTVVNEDLIFNSNAKNVLSVICEDELLQRVDLSNATVKFIVKELASDTDAEAVISKTITDLTSPTAGEFDVTIEQADCADLVGSYLWQMEITMSDSGVFILAEGTTTFTRKIIGITE